MARQSKTELTAENTELRRRITELEASVTERKRAEEALKDSEERYRTLVENAPVGVYKTNLKGEFLYVNRALANRYGFDSPEEMIAAGVLARYKDPSKRANLLKELTTKGRVDNFELEVLTKTGETRNIMLNAVLQDDTLTGMSIDITERKQAEETLQQSEAFLSAVFDGITDFISVHDSQFNIIRTNKMIEQIYGKVAGQKCYQVYKDRNEICPDCTAHKVLATGKPSFAVKQTNYGLPIETWTFPIRDRYGNVIAIIEHGKDITERKRAEEERESLLQRLQAKVEELEAFAYTIAHDLRGPLYSIRSFAETLPQDLAKDKPARVEEDLRAIGSGIDRMEQLLNTILYYSRSGTPVQPSENVPFSEIVTESLAELASQISSAGARLSVAKDFPTVYADRLRMCEVLDNLVRNSIDYREKSRPLTIEIGHQPSDGEVAFFVRDNGIGIAPSKVSRIFELFYRADSASKGVGAGLAIVKRIIEGHGGRIWVESEEGKGTTIYFSLLRQKGRPNS